MEEIIFGNYDWYTTKSPWAKSMDMSICIAAGSLYAATCLIWKFFFEKKTEKTTGKDAKRERRPTNWIEVFHHSFLCLLSIAMFLGMTNSYLDFCLKQGFQTCLSADVSKYDLFNKTTGFWMMVFSASKFYELFDTLFIALKGQEVILLQWWHHATVPFLCSVHFLEQSSSAFTGSAFNCFVHIFMYMHFAVSATGSKLTLLLRPVITALQITQFVVVIGHITWLLLTASNGFSAFPMTFLSCYTIYNSYLLLFIKFARDNYINKAKPTPSRQTSVDGLANDQKKSKDQ